MTTTEMSKLIEEAAAKASASTYGMGFAAVGNVRVTVLSKQSKATGKKFFQTKWYLDGRVVPAEKIAS